MDKEAQIKEIQALREDSEVLEGIRQGLHDCHLGHMFSHRLVSGALEGTGGRFRLYYRLIINLKKFWWRLKTPYQSYQHRNCPHCREFKELLKVKE